MFFYYSNIFYICDLMAGVGGNLVAVQASRLSTALHRVATPGQMPDHAAVGFVSPWSAFFGKSRSSSLLNQSKYFAWLLLVCSFKFRSAF